jgi:exodeoxyribonuclease V alpha subunit
VILVGDPEQLVSVEVGAVLADLVGATDTPPLEDCFVKLHTNHRSGDAQGLEQLAEAIRQDRPQEALERLRDSEHLALHPPPSGSQQLPSALEEGCLSAYRDVASAPTAAEALARLDRLRILCAHRQGHGSVEALNVAMARRLGHDDPRARFRGRPLMVTVNDRALDLANGDVGVLYPAADNDPELRAWFGPAERPRAHLVAELPENVPVFALTIHKSQGSEFDHVVVVLPRAPSRQDAPFSPILTRQLLYTAVTRAKRRVSIVADERSLSHAIASSVKRNSGLTTALRSALRSG